MIALALNHAVPVPVGHRVEITEFTAPEGRSRGSADTQAHAHPAVLDLDTGIRYLNHVHVSAGNNGGNAFRPNAYPFEPRPDLSVARIWRGRVAACTVVEVEGLSAQHTMLAIEPDSGAGAD
jgi:hypothetical protein